MFQRGIGNILRISFPANFAVFIMNVSCFRDRFLLWCDLRSKRFCLSAAHTGRGEGGGGRGVCTQQMFIRGSSAPRSNPLPIYIPFSRKRYPFHIPSIDKWYPLSRFKDIFWVNCPFYLLVKLSFTLTSLETSLQSTIKVKSVRTFPEILVKLVTSPKMNPKSNQKLLLQVGAES